MKRSSWSVDLFPGHQLGVCYHTVGLLMCVFRCIGRHLEVGQVSSCPMNNESIRKAGAEMHLLLVMRSLSTFTVMGATPPPPNGGRPSVATVSGPHPKWLGIYNEEASMFGGAIGQMGQLYQDGASYLDRLPHPSVQKHVWHGQCKHAIQSQSYA